MDPEDADEPGQDPSYRPKYLPTSTDALIGKHRVDGGREADRSGTIFSHIALGQSFEVSDF
jgi:hypothetical protein